MIASAQPAPRSAARLVLTLALLTALTPLATDMFSCAATGSRLTP